MPGARVVYAEADPDHNRLDTTVLGDADTVRASAMAGAAAAVDLIDMREHRGGHPRMGAADVIPFMPVRGVSIEDCVLLARAFGRELAERLDLPVYLYDRAALVPERASLADVRRGEYEGLREAVARGERLPDLGPRTSSGPRARRPSVPASPSWPSTSISTAPMSPPRRRSPGGSASPVAAYRPCGRSVSRCRNAATW